MVYCRAGGMSAIAARTLVKPGYTDVWNLDGGMIGWKQAGYLLKAEHADHAMPAAPAMEHTEHAARLQA